MAVKDLHNNIFVERALDMAAITTDTTTVGNVIAMQGYDSVEFVLETGVVTDGDYSLILTESATTDGTYTAVADADLLGTEPAFTANTDDQALGRVGYIGGLGFLKATILSANTSTGATVAVLAIKGNKNDAPTPANGGV